MSLIFKPKKTYIKKFATNGKLNYSKKIKFSKSVSGFKLSKSALSTGKVTEKANKVIRAENTVKPYVAPKREITAEQIEKIRNDILTKNEKTAVMEKPKTAYVTKSAQKKERPVRKHKNKKISFKSFLKYAVCTVAVCALAVCFVVIAELGIGFIENINLKFNKQNLVNELSVMYAPEDYIYPAPTKDIRESADAYRLENKTPDYTPPQGEVPGIYTSDYEKVCYLTFDDGPSPVTGQVLDILDNYGIKATFFVVGNQINSYPQLLVRMYEGGHSIGNHSYSHDYSSVYRADVDFNDEVITTRNAINYALAGIYENYIFRFPGGSYEDYKQSYKSNLQGMGYEYIDWNALTGDGEIVEPDSEKLMADLVSHTNDGTKEDIVVLMHDAGAKQVTADVLPQVIEYLQKRGYTFKAIWNSNYALNH